MSDYLQHGRRHRPGGSDPIGDYIAFDQPNTDPKGLAGELLIDTGLIEIGDVIQADWVVTAIDYKWVSTGGSGVDFECNGGNFQINVYEDAASGHGVVTVFGQKSITLSSNGFGIQLSANGIQMTGLPTSNPGGTGLLWNNGGVLNIT